MNKSSAKNVLLSVLLGLVAFVFVLSIGYASMAYNITHNGYVEGIASAAVTSFEEGNLYVWNESSGQPSYSNGNYQCNFFAKLSSTAPSTASDITTRILRIYVHETSSYDYVDFCQSYTNYTLTAGDIRSQYSYNGGTWNWYIYNGSSWDIRNKSNFDFYLGSQAQDLGLVTADLGIVNSWRSNVNLYQANFFGGAPEPIFGTDFIEVSFNYRVSGVGLTPYTPDFQTPNWSNFLPNNNGSTGDMTWQLVGFNILNAYEHYGSFSYAGYSVDDVVPIYVEYYYQGSLWTSGYVFCSAVYDEASEDDEQYKFYLILCVPTGTEKIKVYFAIDSAGQQVSSFSGQSSTELTASSDVFSTYISNYQKIYNSPLLVYQYQKGYSAGEQSNSDNNLFSLIWSAFKLPFTLLFGEYNNTTHLYEGGLFNFTFLGVDLRAFVLSLMSVCLIIACIKLVLGMRGGSGD